MTSIPVARALARSGLTWTPARGDRFVIPDREMDGDVFVLSDMTIEAHEHPGGAVIGFNGTTEWALDSVAARDTLWLPDEGQLREALGERFASLRREGDEWVVAVSAPSGTAEVRNADAEEAYAVALLSVRAVTARDLLPVAAHALSRRLEALGPATAPGWGALVPDGVRTVATAAAGVLGADAATAWRPLLAELLAAWAGPDSQDAGVAEAGAQGVLVDLLTAAWDVARAAGHGEVLDPACVAVALRHVRTWGTVTSVADAPDGGPDDVPADVDAPQQRQADLLARTGR